MKNDYKSNGVTMNIYFVVLHYIVIQETINCVESIKNIKNHNSKKHIIVVDNGSNNGTGDKLKEKYSEDREVTVVLSNDNLGFAKGNNLGLKQIEDKKKSIVFVCNSDVLFGQEDICERVIEIYRRTGFSVLGPDVTSQDKVIHENPTICEISDPQSLRTQLRRFKFENAMNIIGLTLLSRVFNKILNKKTLKLDYQKECNSKDYNIKLHGSCLVFSPVFFENFEGFFEGTFLFQEENILSDMCRRKGLLMVYSPKVRVVHLGSRSYKRKFKNGNKRFKNYVENCLSSLKNYSAYLERNE